MKKTDVRLYNVIFPVWLLWIIPVTWLVVIPANLLIDFTVIYVTMRCMGVENRKEEVKKSIIAVWLLGFAADFIGTAIMFVPALLDMNYDMVDGIMMNPFSNIWALVWVTGSFVVATACIYFFNYKVCYKHTDLNNCQKRKLALNMTIFTAPYLFYLPSEWFY